MNIEEILSISEYNDKTVIDKEEDMGHLGKNIKDVVIQTLDEVNKLADRTVDIEAELTSINKKLNKQDDYMKTAFEN